MTKKKKPDKQKTNKTKAKKIKTAVIVLVLLGISFVLSIFLVSWYVVSIGTQYIVSFAEQPTGDAIIVLGARVYANGKVSNMLKDRLDFAVALYRQNAAPKILVSGDHGKKDYDEVNAMRSYLLAQGVLSEDIFMDHAGFNTYNSMYRAKYIFCVDKPIIVSQRYHIIRANYIGKALGLDISSVGADTRRYEGMRSYELREYASRYKAFFQCLFRARPVFLGDVIPIWGNGEVTRD